MFADIVDNPTELSKIIEYFYNTIYMHGGFENETPNIPTNSIMRLDLTAHVKSNPYLLEKLEKVF